MRQQEIISLWKTEKGVWCNKTDKFINRKTTAKTRTIVMKITDSPNGKILSFIGRPTRFEQYYISSLNFNKKQDLFCICGGTINRWPQCLVFSQDMLDFINAEKE